MRKNCPHNRRNDKPFIIPVFIPHHGCPHRCVFCNQVSITGRAPVTIDAAYVRAAVESFAGYGSGARRSSRIAFYGGNFLGLADEVAVELLREAARYVKTRVADSIGFSTRPDTVTPDTLSMIAEFPVKTIEVGAQSMDDGVLRLAGRGHAAADTENAVRLLGHGGYRVGVQMMTGLPGDNEEKALLSAARIAALAPDFVRIYPTLVLEGSPLAARFRVGEYTPPELEIAMDLVKRMYLLFKGNNIPVVRMGLMMSETGPETSSVIAGPYHPAFGHMVLSAVFLERAVEKLRNCHDVRGAVTLVVHPRNVSRMQGLEKRNLDALKRMFPIERIQIRPDSSLGMDAVEVLQTGIKDPT